MSQPDAIKPPTFRPKSIRVTDYIRDAFEALAHVHGLQTADDYAVYWISKKLDEDKAGIDWLIRRTKEDREARALDYQERLKKLSTPEDQLP